MDASFPCLTWRDELLTLAAEIEIANFPEASSAVSCGGLEQTPAAD
jgi:hypothetical protein